MTSGRLWWFLLANNGAILGLFSYKLVERGHLQIGNIFYPEEWHFQSSGISMIIGAAPFILSFCFVVYKVIRVKYSPDTTPLDHQEVASQV